jgi:MFS family permease
MVTKLHISPRRKDFSLAKASIILIAASFVVLAFAPNVWLVVVALVLYAAGCGFGSFVRSLLSSLLVPDMLGTLYMILSVVDTLSGLISGPLCAEALKLGVRLHGFWHGLPYMLSAGLCIVAACLMFAVTVEDRVKGNEEEPLLREQQ